MDILTGWLTALQLLLLSVFTFVIALIVKTGCSSLACQNMTDISLISLPGSVTVIYIDVPMRLLSVAVPIVLLLSAFGQCLQTWKSTTQSRFAPDYDTKPKKGVRITTWTGRVHRGLGNYYKGLTHSKRRTRRSQGLFPTNSRIVRLCVQLGRVTNYLQVSMDGRVNGTVDRNHPNSE